MSWISRPGPYNGIAKVYLDGKLVKTLDLYKKKTQFKKTVWSVSKLSSTTHTVKIVLKGEKPFIGLGGFSGTASWNVLFQLVQSRSSRGVATF